MTSRSPALLAKDDLGLLRMEPQLAPLEPFFNPMADEPSLSLRPAVNDHIIRIPLEGERRILIRHPLIEHVMQKDIGQKR